MAKSDQYIADCDALKKEIYDLEWDINELYLQLPIKSRGYAMQLKTQIISKVKTSDKKNRELIHLHRRRSALLEIKYKYEQLLKKGKSNGHRN